MVTFENLVNNIKENNYSYEEAKSMCEHIAGMDIEDYDFADDWITYSKKGFGTIVLTKNKKGGIKEIRAWNEDNTFVL